MESQAYILKRVYDGLSADPVRIRLYDVFDAPSWDDVQFVRSCTVRAEHGEPSGWDDFLNALRSNKRLRSAAYKILDDEFMLFPDWESGDLRFQLPSNISQLHPRDVERLLQSLEPNEPAGCLVEVVDAHFRPIPELDYIEHPDHFIEPKRVRRSQVMYVENKPEHSSGSGRICRVGFSKSGKTIYYDGQKLQSLKGSASKANYYSVETALWYWVSKCHKDGNDTLYLGIVEIDHDVREEYWTEIRNQPENKHLTRIRSPGKHSKHRPC